MTKNNRYSSGSVALSVLGGVWVMAILGTILAASNPACSDFGGLACIAFSAVAFIVLLGMTIAVPVLIRKGNPFAAATMSVVLGIIVIGLSCSTVIVDFFYEDSYRDVSREEVGEIVSQTELHYDEDTEEDAIFVEYGLSGSANFVKTKHALSIRFDKGLDRQKISGVIDSGQPIVLVYKEKSIDRPYFLNYFLVSDVRGIEEYRGTGQVGQVMRGKFAVGTEYYSGMEEEGYERMGFIDEDGKKYSVYWETRIVGAEERALAEKLLENKAKKILKDPNQIAEIEAFVGNLGDSALSVKWIFD